MLQKIYRQFQITQMGYPLEQFFAKNHVFKGESHPFIEMVFVANGKVEISEDEKIYTLGERDLLLHAPMEFHSIKSAASTEPHFYNLSFTVSGTLPQKLFDGVFHLRQTQQEAFDRLFVFAQQFLKREDPTPLAAQRAADALSDFLMELCQDAPINPFAEGAAALLYKKLVRDMQKKICRNLSLEELAQENHVSISYIKKLFTQYAGISPKQYFLILRGKEAVHLLESGLSAAEVAERMNFSSPNYFTLFFKKQIGLTPSEYKKQRL